MRNIIEKVERARGCGMRKSKGIYFVSTGIGIPCCKLPFLLHVCPTCNGGIKQARGFTWINTDLFKGEGGCIQPYMAGDPCPMQNFGQRVGLMWVGEKFYPTPEHFTKEANEMGVSKRIAQIPKDFVVGQDWIFLAHPKAVAGIKINENGVEEQGYGPGIFHAFKPTAIEYVVKGDETDEELDRLEKRGLTLVKVIPEEKEPVMHYESNNDGRMDNDPTYG